MKGFGESLKRLAGAGVILGAAASAEAASTHDKSPVEDAITVVTKQGTERVAKAREEHQKHIDSYLEITRRFQALVHEAEARMQGTGVAAERPTDPEAVRVFGELHTIALKLLDAAIKDENLSEPLVESEEMTSDQNRLALEKDFVQITTTLPPEVLREIQIQVLVAIIATEEERRK